MDACCYLVGIWHFYLLVEAVLPSNIYGHIGMGTDLCEHIMLPPWEIRLSTQWLDIPLSDISLILKLTNLSPIIIILLNVRLVSDKHHLCISLIWLGHDSNFQPFTQGSSALAIGPSRLFLFWHSVNKLYFNVFLNTPENKSNVRHRQSFYTSAFIQKEG